MINNFHILMLHAIIKKHCRNINNGFINHDLDYKILSLIYIDSMRDQVFIYCVLRYLNYMYVWKYACANPDVAFVRVLYWAYFHVKKKDNIIIFIPVFHSFCIHRVYIYLFLYITHLTCSTIDINTYLPNSVPL